MSDTAEKMNNLYIFGDNHQYHLQKHFRPEYSIRKDFYSLFCVYPSKCFHFVPKPTLSRRFHKFYPEFGVF